MKSTCSYLCLKVTYFAFEDVRCIEVMGCVKKLSQTVPARSELEYWDTRTMGGFLEYVQQYDESVLVLQLYNVSLGSWDPRIPAMSLRDVVQV